MTPLLVRFRHFLSSLLVILVVASPALADDTEIYGSQASSTSAKPNVLFVIDTSGSMDTDVTVSAPLYDPSVTYPTVGSCTSTRIYFGTADTVPTCSTSTSFASTQNTCNASATALATGGSGVWPAFGNSAARIAQLRTYWFGTTWQTLSGGDSGKVECQADNGVHGETNSNKPYIKNGDWVTEGGWSATDYSLWSGLTTTYRLYSANYINYKYGAGSVTTMTRLQIVRDVAVSLAGSLQNVNLGLMRYSSTGEGGYVLNAIGSIDTNRSTIISQLQSFTPTSGDGSTPLSETFYEAAQYLKGGTVDYGYSSKPGTSDTASRTPATSTSKTYKSPIQYQCQKNFIVYLTDGLPTQDADGNAKIAKMVGKSACAADSSPPAHDSGYTEGSGMCMDDLAAYLSSSSTDLSSSVSGSQNALTYMIGFGDSIAGNVAYLDMVAKAGGTGHAYTAADVDTLTTALQQIFGSIQQESGVFVTPSLTTNAFNRSQASSDLYFSLFKVGTGTHWGGNLKKYQLLDGEKIVDAKGADAIDSTGFFADGTTSIWSTTADGGDVTKGGAANLLALPASRKLYTYLGSKNLTSDATNVLDTANTKLTDVVVGAGTSTSACSATCTQAIQWARGIDVDDADADGDKTDQVKFMGDPLHGSPGVVTYGGTASAPDDTDIVVYVPTNDGFLHAINGKTGGDGGKELWAFMPPELLSRLTNLRSNAATTQRTYGLDSDIRVLKLDYNQNGIVEKSDGDRVWLFFGMRAGGNHYYGLDVTDRNNPQLLWDIGPTELPGVGQSWSPPSLTRVKVTGSRANDDPQRFVLIFGGGYDTTQESQPYLQDTVGNTIYMVDAQTGKLLWYTSGTTTRTPAPDLSLSTSGKAMNNSIPARITVIDTNGDLYADRMYAADMGGRIWRFDIFNGNPSSTLVTGGLLATLGDGSATTAPVESNRRFYSAPDAAYISYHGQEPYYNIAIGSGYRGHPLNTTTQERFYSVRDKSPSVQLSQTAYNALVPITDSDLIDISSDPEDAVVPVSASGWKLSMNREGWVGEKVLAESTTANGVILFTSYQPRLPSSTSGTCYPSSLNRVYAVSARNGRPILDLNADGEINNSDLSLELTQGGIVGKVSVGFVRSSGSSTDSSDDSVTLIAIPGVDSPIPILKSGDTVRTFWQRDDAP